MRKTKQRENVVREKGLKGLKKKERQTNHRDSVKKKKGGGRA